MQSALYVTLSAQVALERRMETLSHNVANMNTGGFRAQEVKFATVLSKTASDSVAFSSAGETFLSRRAGSLTKTDNPLDVAVQGDAWFAFRGPRGAVYTRDGRLNMQETGDLQTVDGYPVLDAGGGPITLDPQGGPVTIGRDGAIRQGGNQVGVLGLFTIPDRARLTRFENSGVIPDRPAEPVQDFTSAGVAQGYAEGANINPVQEMSRLIMVQRTFESAASAVRETESTLQSAIRDLGSTT